MRALNKFILAVVLIVTVIFIGTIGYMILENGDFVDSLYMTIITISTVGFKEVFPLTDAGKIFTVFLIFSSLSILAFGINIISSFIIEGEFRDISRRRRMEKRLKKLKDHYIVCGSGQTAQQVIKQFLVSKVKFVVISHRNDPEEEREKIMTREDIIYIDGDATNDEILKEAKVEEAKGLIAALSTDTENLFVILSARSLNSNLQIVARAIEGSSLQKMRKAGASHVISPDIIGGIRMASVVLRPTIVDFLDIMCTSEGDISLKMEQVSVPANSNVNGKTLRELKIPKKTGLIVVAIKEPDSEKFKYNPTSDYVLKSGDVLLVLGKNKQIQKLKEYVET